MHIIVRHASNDSRSNHVCTLPGVIPGIGDLPIDDCVEAIRDPAIRSVAVVERDRVEEVLEGCIDRDSDENLIWRC